MAERSESHRGTMSHNNSICKFRNYSRDSSLAAHDFSTKFRRHLFYRGQPSPAFRDAESVRRQLYKGGMLTGVRDAAAGRSPQVIGSKAGDSVLNFLPFLYLCAIHISESYCFWVDKTTNFNEAKKTVVFPRHARALPVWLRVLGRTHLPTEGSPRFFMHERSPLPRKRIIFS